MNKIIGLLFVLVVGLILFFNVIPKETAKRRNPVFASPPYNVSNDAKSVNESLFISDLHADSLLWDRDLLVYGTSGHVDVPRLINGNVGLQIFSVVTKVPMGHNIDNTASNGLDMITLLAVAQLWPMHTWVSLMERALYQAKKLHAFSSKSNGRLILIESASDLRRYIDLRKHNKDMVAGLLGIEGAHSLEGKLQNIDKLYDAGFRVIGLTHFFDNEIGGSAHGEQKGGLTKIGMEVIKRAEKLGIIIDLAHASSVLIDDVLKISTKPVIVSHTGVRGTCNNQRNLTDEQIHSIAISGGVIGIGYWQTAVCGMDVEAIVKAIQYTVSLVGVEHVALGSDFDGAVKAMFDTTGISKITESLLNKGFSKDDIQKIMGLNVVSVLLETLPSD